MDQAKKLGFGLMRLPLIDKSDAGSVDVEQVKKMVDTFISGGFTYFCCRCIGIKEKKLLASIKKICYSTL